MTNTNKIVEGVHFVATMSDGDKVELFSNVEQADGTLAYTLYAPTNAIVIPTMEDLKSLHEIIGRMIEKNATGNVR